MAISYKIDNKFGITFDVNEAVVVQPTWPDGTPFSSKDEAEKWAKTFVGYIKDESAPQPGNSPDKPVLSDEDLVDYEAVAEFEKRMEEERKAAEEKAAQAEAELVAADDVEIEAELKKIEDVVDAEVVED